MVCIFNLSLYKIPFIMKSKICFITLFFLIIWNSYSQKSDKQNNSSIARFKYKGYNSLGEYIKRNADFSLDAANNTGVIIAAIVIDNKGQIVNVFNLNSLVPSVDNNIITTLKNTTTHWKPLDDSVEYSLDTIAIPIVFKFMDTEYKIDRKNCKLAVEKEVEVLKYINGQPVLYNSGYITTKALLKKYDKAFSESKFDEATDILKSLLKREPLNSDYYAKLLSLNIKQGRKFAACNNLKYMRNYLLIQPDLSVIQGFECN
jgi:hypothetical protein